MAVNVGIAVLGWLCLVVVSFLCYRGVWLRATTVSVCIAFLGWLYLCLVESVIEEFG